MAACFLDTSAIVKRYVAETGSLFVRRITDINNGNDVRIATVTCVEVVAALYRRVRTGSLTLADAALAEQAFRQDIHSTCLLWDLTPSIYSQAMAFAKLHPLRAYDAIQLAATVDLDARRRHRNLVPLTFLSADQALNQAALAEGLVVDDPNRYP